MTRFEMRDASGALRVHVRKDYLDADGVPYKPKVMWWEPKGVVHSTEMPLWRLDELLAAPTDAPVYVCEGETSTNTAQGAGLLAVGTVCGAGSVPTDDRLRPLLGHRVILWPDQDPDDKGQTHMRQIATRLLAMGHPDERLMWVDWRAAPPKGDAVDFFARGGSVDGVQALLVPFTPLAQPSERESAPHLDSTQDSTRDSTQDSIGETAEASAASGAIDDDARGEDEPYRATPGGLRRIKREVDQAGKSKETLIPLTNFNARVIADTLEDDGAEIRRIFDMEATLCVGDDAHRMPRYFQLPWDRFSVMGWPTEHLGAAAIVYPRQSAHADVAIRTLSGIVPERRVFTHTGWRQVDATWVYLHAGGAIGAKGVHADVSVALSGDLARYELPALPEPDAQHTNREIVEATRASIRMLEVAPIVVTAPLYAAVWRAPLGNADFAVHIGGQTGEGKSELAALAQQHYGATMNARHLPASWSSTGNALEAQAFHAKDALLVIDDFIPTGTTADAQRLHGVAERVLRAQGNHSGRQRLHADTTQRPTKPPRGLILSTGEDVPRGTSLRARLLVVEHAPGTIDWDKLSDCQRDAEGGRFALAMAAYIRWVAAHYEDIQAELRPQAVREALADRLGGRATHKRTSDNVAQLLAAVAIFSRYACEIGALTASEAEALLARMEQALLQVGEQQAALQAQGDPVMRFLTLLNTAIMSGAAYVADRQGKHPGDAKTPWGWRQQKRGVGENMLVEWVPIGRDKVGWLDGDNLYILPDAAFAAAQRIGQASGDALTVTAGTLWKRLKERGFLLSWDAPRQTNRVRVIAEGSTQNVLHLHVSALTSCSPAGRSTPDPDDEAPAGPMHTHTPNNPNPPNNPSATEPPCRVSVSDGGTASANPTRHPTRVAGDTMGANGAIVGCVGFAAPESTTRATSPTSTGTPTVSGIPSSAAPSAAHGPARYPTAIPDTLDKRVEMLGRAERLGWPDVQVAPHLRVTGERGWRSIARPGGSDADVARALESLAQLQARGGGVQYTVQQTEAHS
ncbi:MAG TPA: DUF927 domain-containing protein [Ktedonobacterales bacterium]|nr:DUF927 domain-containing protein [Ktedonobacterales bacterium]